MRLRMLVRACPSTDWTVSTSGAQCLRAHAHIPGKDKYLRCHHNLLVGTRRIRRASMHKVGVVSTEISVDTQSHLHRMAVTFATTAVPIRICACGLRDYLGYCGETDEAGVGLETRACLSEEEERAQSFAWKIGRRWLTGLNGT